MGQDPPSAPEQSARAVRQGLRYCWPEMAYWVLKAILTPVLRFFYRVRVEGLDNVPADGAAILAGNHLAVCDSFFLPLALRRRITFVAKAEYFEDPKTAGFFRAPAQIPINREGGPPPTSPPD